MMKTISFGQQRTIDKAIFRTIPLRIISFLIVAAAGIWLAACSAAPAQSPAVARPSAATSGPTAAGRASTPAAGSPVSPSGTATTSASPKGASTPAGAGPSAATSPAAATNVKPKTLAVNDGGPGGITVNATWVVPGSPEASIAQLDRYVAFKVVLDTHSGDLTKLDLTKVSVLRDDKGKENQPAAWENVSNDSHHREGILKFPKGAEQGSKTVELVVKDVGGVKERVLKWELGS